MSVDVKDGELRVFRTAVRVQGTLPPRSWVRFSPNSVKAFVGKVVIASPCSS